MTPCYGSEAARLVRCLWGSYGCVDRVLIEIDDSVRHFTQFWCMRDEVLLPVPVAVTATSAIGSETPIPVMVDLPQKDNPDAGSLGGAIAVGNDGTASYVIPLQLPPGSGGMQPQLTLQYGSNNTTGVAGLGWSIGGLSNIDRCGKTVATDNHADGVRFMKRSDRLCLDGQRLVLVNGPAGAAADDDAYWSDTAEYRTEVDSFARVRTAVSNGKRVFTVEQRDGRVLTYGDTADSYVVGFGRSDGQAHRWRVSRTADRSGNEIAYQYSDKGDGEVRIQSVRWGGNTNAAKPHYAIAKFHYEARPDVREAYVAGSLAMDSERLARIETRTNTDGNGNSGVLVHNYNLDYEVSPSSGRSLLKSVEWCDRNSVCLPKTSFSWGQPKNGSGGFVQLGGTWTGPDLHMLGTAQNIPGSNYATPSAMDSIIAGDFNNDGKTDLLERYRVTVGGVPRPQRLYISSASGWTESVPFDLTSINLAVMESGDFDGDGLTDLLVADMIAGSDSATNWRMCLGKNILADRFDCRTSVSFPTDATKPANFEQPPRPARVVKDFNADGKDDIFFRSGEVQLPAWKDPRYMCLSTGSGFDCKSVWTEGATDIAFGAANSRNRHSGNVHSDVDGDGRVDNISLARCSRMPREEAAGVEWRCDAFGSDGVGGIHVTSEAEKGAYSMWGEWFTFPDMRTLVMPPPDSGSLTADLNADGYTDLVFAGADLDQIDPDPLRYRAHVCFSRGDSRGVCKALPLPANRDPRHLVMNVADFDGDGSPDVLRPGSDLWTTNDIVGFELCRINGDGTTHSCRPWNGPTYYGVNEKLSIDGGRLDNEMTRKRSSFLGDFNGDGRPDILTYLGGSSWRIDVADDMASSGEALDRLATATNGYGHEERLEYAWSNDSSVYTPNVQLPSGDLAPVVGKRSRPMTPMVKKVRRAANGGGWNETTYAYGGYANDPNGRGNLGFAMVRSTDRESGITSTVWPYQQFPHVGAPRYARSTSREGTILSDTVETRQTVEIGQANGVRTVWSYVSKSETSTQDLDESDMGKVTIVNSEIDSWGNIGRTVSTSTRDGISFTATNDPSFENDATAWLIGKPREVKEIRSANGSDITRTVNYTYDALGRLQTETREKGTESLRTTLTFGRNVFGQVESSVLDWKDPVTKAVKQRSSIIRYDSIGRFVESKTNALDHVEVVKFDSGTGAQTSLTDANGLETTMLSDGFGRRQMLRGPDGNEIWTFVKQCAGACPPEAATVTIQYSARGGSSVLTGVPTLVFANAQGKPLRTLTWGFNGERIATDVRHDSKGRPTQHYWPRLVSDSQALGSASGEPPASALQKELFYDDLDRVVMIETLDEAGNRLSQTTTYRGPVRSEENALHHVRSERRDQWGRLSSATDANNKTTLYNYDAFGNLTKVTDPLGNEVNVQYDVLGRKTDLDDRDMGKIHYDVDPVGQVYKQISPVQKKASTFTSFEYDKLGRLTARLEGSLKAYWQFDLADGETNCVNKRTCGQLVQAYTLSNTAKNYTREHKFDNIGRLIQQVTRIDNTSYTSTTDYDTWGRVARERHQRGSDLEKVFERRYNAWGQLSRIERGGALLWQAVTLDASMRLTHAKLGNELSVVRDYDALTGYLSGASLINSTGGEELSEGYKYDALGNVKVREQQWPVLDTSAGPVLGFEETFGYDKLNRLESAVLKAQSTKLTLEQQSQVFTYDDIGNLKSKTGTGTGVYNYAASGATSVRPHAVMSIAGVTGSFTYDDNGNMLTAPFSRTMTWTSFDMPATVKKGTLTSTFSYGPERQRTTQVRSDGIETAYAGAIEVEKKGNVITVKTYWPLGLGMELESNGTTKLYWTHDDRLGSTVAISDATGNVVERLAYDAWGKRRQFAGKTTPDTLDGVIDNKGYTGHEMLDGQDLVHMNGRVYDPFVARFISADPIIQDPTHSQSYNRYSYVWNNPTNLTDPTGFAAQGSGNVLGELADANAFLKCLASPGASCGGTIANWAIEKWTGDSKPSSSAESSGGKSSTSNSIQVEKKGSGGSANSTESGGPLGPPPGQGGANASGVPRIEDLPAYVGDSLKKAGVKVEYVKESVVEYFSDLRGQSVPGHEDKTWDTMPGVFWKKTVVLAKEDTYWRDQTSRNLAFHEIGHAFDYSANWISRRLDFQQAWGNDQSRFKLNYYRTRPYEAFAETFARYHGGDKTLRKDWPSLYDYMKVYDGCKKGGFDGC